jgi:RES domain-containing protein
LSTIIWRISKAKYAQTAFDGEGARLWGGRWNSRGRSVVYTSANSSLATLESLVHLGVKDSKVPYVLIRAEIPEQVAIQLITEDRLPENWREDPSPISLAEIGDKWLDSTETAVLALPSAINPHENNYLINPLHPDFQKIIIFEPQPYKFDLRLFQKRD